MSTSRGGDFKKVKILFSIEIAKLLFNIMLIIMLSRQTNTMFNIINTNFSPA